MPDKDIYEDFQRRTAEFLQHMQTDKSFHPFHRSKTARETARWNALYHGEIAPTDDGFFGELSDRFQGAYIGSLHGLGATLNEFSLGSGMQDYFSGVLRRNQQWNAPDENSIGGYIGGSLGGAVGSTLGTLTASTAGKFIGTAMGGPKVGYAVGMTAGITVGFMQTFGENVQRNREAGYGENKALGMAFLESVVDSVIENMPWGIVGKGGKLAVNAGRISRITAAGKRELLKKVGQKMAAQVGQENAQNLLWKWAKQATVSGLGESGEEGLQFLNSYVNQKLGGDPNAKFSMDELADAMAQGFIGGFGMGGVTSLPGIRHEAKMRKLNTATDTATETVTDTATDIATAQPEAVNTPIPEVAGAEIEQPAGEVSEAVNNEQPLFDTLIADVGNALGINIDFMDSLPNGAELEEEKNGFYVKKNKTLYLNRNTYSVNPAETLGHELKHYIDDNIPELSKAFNSLLEAGKTEAGKREVSEIAKAFGITEAEGNTEFSADMFGKLFARPETWKKMAAQLDERTPGMGEKFLQTLRDFYALVKRTLSAYQSPEAETFLNNVTDLENEAARMLAELRRRNGNSTQVENVELNQEAGSDADVVVSETEKTTDKNGQKPTETDNDVVSAENAQTTPAKSVEEKQTETAEPIPPSAEKSSGDSNNALQKMRNAFDNRVEIRNSTSKQMPWTDIAREYADGKVLSKEADDLIINEIADMSMEDYQNSEVNNILHAIASNPIHSVRARSRAKSALKSIEKKRLGFAGAITLDSTKTVAEMIAEDENLWEQEKKRYPDTDPSKSVFKQRLDYLKSLSEKEIVEHDVLVKEEKGETAATAKESSEVEETPEEIERKRIQKIYADIPNRKDEIGYTFKEFKQAFKERKNKIVNAADRHFASHSDTWYGTKVVDQYEMAADDALVKAYKKYYRKKGELENYVSRAIKNAIKDVNRKAVTDYYAKGGNISLDQTNEQGEALSEAVADENETIESDSISSRENPQEAKRRITESKKLSPVQKKIVDLFNQDLSPSEVIRKLGKRFGEEGHEYMSKEEFQHQIVAIRTIAEEEGVLYSRKRGTEEKPIVNIMPDTPEGIELKSIPDVREYLRSIFEGKKFKIKSDGRPTAIDFAGIRSAVKKRGINRQALFDAQNIVINSYLVGYEYADLRHLNKHQNINGQFIYVSLIDINSKPFAAVIKLDDFANDQYAIFKDIAVKKITPAVRGTTGNGTIANPPDQVSGVTIHQLVDFVKQHFKENKNFTENVADVFEKRLDNAYFAALEKGDIKRAELMVKNAAKRSVYHEDSDYQGSLAFNGSAPAKNEYYESKEDRADAWNNGNYEGEFSLGDFADNGIDTHDLEWQLTNPTAYRIADSFGKESIRNLQSAVKNPRKTIKIYRAVDANIKENSIRNGDWVTPGKSYATQHIELQDWEHGRIIEQEVSIDDIWWNGDDINEWGYDDGKNYAYANTPNNRKLLDTVTYDDNGNIIPLSQRFNRRKEDVRYSRKRLHQQVNPIVRDGKVRDEYADLLANKEYTPTTLKELQDKAFNWILERGGIVKAAQDFLANKAPADSAVAEIARRYILNSDVFTDNMSVDDRVKLNTLEINERSKAGLTLRSMRLDSLNLKDVASVQALLNKLHKDMPSKDLQKLRNDIMKNLGIDIFKLPKDIVDDKSKLDALLRAELAHKAKWHDKIYEYWINGILSGPSTHASNLLGNTANAVYELGIKRFTEALVNIAAGRKDGATFGEFKAMIKAFNWANAKAAAKEAFDLEVIDPSGKFLENSNTAIGGKTGRAIRTPGRLLKAADALAKAIIQPMETAAYAYRMGVQEGLTGTKLQEYIQKQLTDKDSKAYQWAKERAKELTFQEDPGSAVKYLMAMKESDGAMGIILKMFLPFLKTPANILRQGVRKGPLGILNLAGETVKLALGKRDFDGQYVARVAEQLLAWGVVMALAGLSDDDELPVITGTSAPYGSAEYGFKGNKVPPYSIRIGNTWYSYQKIEPFATGLAAIADGIQAFRDAKNGKDGTAVMKELIGSAIKTIGEKSYLDSIGEIIKMVQDPERNALRPVTNLLASSVPALWRQPRQAFTEEVGDSKSRSRGLDWWREQFFTVTNRAGITTAIPKIDYFGRDVKKDDWGDTPLSPAGRILPVKRVEADSNMDQAERLIWNYNQKNPNSEYYPSIPGNTFTVDKQKLYLDGENYMNFAKDAGELAHRQIKNAIVAGRLNVNNPSEKDIELIKKIFTRARKETRAKYISKAKKQ